MEEEVVLDIRQEYIRCCADFEYVCRKYFKIEDKTRGGYYPFELLPHQKEVFWNYEDHEKCITNKYRQSGITTMTCAYAAWKLVTEKGTKIALIANKLQLGQGELFKKTVEFMDQLPEFMRPNYDKKNTAKHKMLDNGSELFVAAASKSGLRGYSPNYLIMDEMAFFEYGQEFWTATISSISTGGRVICISTPNGRANIFYEIYDNAKTKNNDFHCVELKWYKDARLIKDLEFVLGDEKVIEWDYKKQDELIAKGYKPTSSWYRRECRAFNNNKKRIAQELEGAFIGSGGTVIDDQDILTQEQQNVKEPIRYEYADRNFWIWEDPVEGESYGLGSDVSLGGAEDYSTISIINLKTRVQVAEYQGKVQPDVLGEIIYTWGTRYNNAYVVVDVTGGIGVSTIIKLIDLGYKNLHYSDIKDQAAKDRLGAFQKWDNKMPGFQIGINRTELIYVLEKTFRDNEIICRSARLMAELKSFVIVNGRADHSRSSHDDLIWALLLIIYVSQTSIGKINRNAEATKQMLDSWVVIDYNQQLEDPEDYMPEPKPSDNNGLPNTFYFFGGDDY